MNKILPATMVGVNVKELRRSITFSQPEQPRFLMRNGALEGGLPQGFHLELQS
jgi:hypothetical protein